MFVIILIFSLIIELLTLGLLSETNIAPISGNILTIINIIFATFILLKVEKKYRVPIIITFLIRCLFMFFDILGRNYATLPMSGDDTEGFYYSGLLYGSGYDIINGNLYGEMYSKFIGAIFRITGDQRVFIQYINVALSVITILILIKILKQLNINDNFISRSVWIISVMPMNIIISSVLLRESILIFLLTLGLYHYLNYTTNNSGLSLFLTSVSLILSSMFHSGIIVLLITLIFYEFIKKNRDANIIKNTIILIIVVTILLIFKSSIFDKFFHQINIIQNNDTYITKAGSRYMGNIYINNINLVLKYGWLKMIYFLFSPTPRYWRDSVDMITFLSDSLIYLYLSFKILMLLNKPKMGRDTNYFSLLFGLLMLIFIFGLGTSSAGTAIRHRNKFITLFLILYSISEDIKFKKSNIMVDIKFSF